MARQSLKVPHLNSKIPCPPKDSHYFTLRSTDGSLPSPKAATVCADSDAEYCLGKLKRGTSGSGGEGRTDHHPHAGAVLLKYGCTIS